MPKHSYNRPWPQNLFYDFGLSAISPADAEAFVAGLPTTERNRTFLLLRYREGKTYKEIAAIHGMTPAGVRLAIIAMQEKFGGEAISTQVTAVEKWCRSPRPCSHPRPRTHRPLCPLLRQAHRPLWEMMRQKRRRPPDPSPSTLPLSNVSWA